MESRLKKGEKKNRSLMMKIGIYFAGGIFSLLFGFGMTYLAGMIFLIES